MVDTIYPISYLWNDQGAPQLTGAAGSVINVLDACLVTGYNVRGVTSATYTNGVVTLAVGQAHGFRDTHWIKVAGADQPEYNGTFRIKEVRDEEITYEVPTVSASPATGSIEVRVAPAGWEKFLDSGDGQKAAYKQTPLDSTQHILYIDDSRTDRITVLKGYKTMFDLDTGEDPFPYYPGKNKWIYWYKSTDGTSVRRWSLASDDRLFYFVWNINGDFTDDNDWRLGAFGDIISFVPNDQWHCIINGSYSSSSDSRYEPRYQGPLVSKPYADVSYDSLYGDRGTHIAKSFNGFDVGVLLMGALQPTFGDYNWYRGSGGSVDTNPPGRFGLQYPNPADGGAYLYKLYPLEGYKYRSLVRGELPGIYGLLHDLPFKEDLEFVDFVVNGETKHFIVFSMLGYNANQSYNLMYGGQMLINLTDKWR